MRHPRFPLLAITAALLVAGCATSNDLKSKGPVVTQPIVTTRGPATEAAAEKLLDDAAGADTKKEQTQLERLVGSVRTSLSSPLTAGNKVTVLVDGPATFVAIDKAIAAARHHIHVETYIFADDQFGQKFADLLIAKRQQGVEVRVVYDGLGSVSTAGDFFEKLKAAGVEVVEFRPLNPVKTFFWHMHNRDHRKIIIVDGRVAFTGGLNISGAYSASSASKPGPESGLKEGWRDTHVQIEGPVVEQFQQLFLDTWSQLGGMLMTPSSSYYPPTSPIGADLVSAVGSSGLKQQDEAIYKSYLAAIRNCSSRIWITQAYFLPPEELRDALIEAASRGVDVRIVVPGFTDSKLVLSASHREFEPLLKGGVRLAEAEDALLHAKTALIDNSLVIIGSANLDYRSFLHNNEVTAVIIGDDTGHRMQAVFTKDWDQGKEITLSEWKKRSLWQKTKESVSGVLKFWL
jgi:cardiolipin synthase